MSSTQQTATSAAANPGHRTRLAMLVAVVLLGPASLTGCAAIGGDDHEQVVGSSESKVGSRSGQDLDCGKSPSPGAGKKKPKTKQEQMLGGEEAGDENPMMWAVKEIGTTLFDSGVEEGFGWLFHILAHSKGEGEGHASSTEAKITDLQGRIYNLCTSLDNRLDDLSKQIDLDSYEETASSTTQGALSDLKTYTRQYSEVKADLQDYANKGTLLDDDDVDDVKTLRKGLLSVVDQLDTAMTSSPDKDGLIGRYADVLSGVYGYAPVTTKQHGSPTHILPAEYVQAAYDMYNYYASAAVHALQMYADVINLDYHEGATTITANARDGVTASTDLLRTLDGWGAELWGGRATGKSSWVSHDLGTIPDGTVADLRVQGSPTLWTTSPVALWGDSPDAPPAYCPITSAYCNLDVHDSQGDLGNLAVSIPVRPSPGDITGLLKVQKPMGIADWRIPRTADWNALQSGATGDLATWGKNNRLPLFGTRKYSATYLGTKDDLTVVPPRLVDLGANRYGVADASADAGKLTVRTPSDSPMGATAGYLYLARDLTPTPSTLTNES